MRECETLEMNSKWGLRREREREMGEIGEWVNMKEELDDGTEDWNRSCSGLYNPWRGSSLRLKGKNRKAVSDRDFSSALASLPREFANELRIANCENANGHLRTIKKMEWTGENHPEATTGFHYSRVIVCDSK